MHQVLGIQAQSTLCGRLKVNRQTINVQTGEVTQIPLTAEEIAEREAYERDVLPGVLLENLRQRRNQLLTETDWVTLKAIDDSNDGLGIQLPQVWMDYRQALRDLPANTVDPANPVWPTKPGGN
jgi:hypothetical protein